LVHYEAFGDIRSAIAREKEIKGWSRAKKVRLIELKNPTWADLAERGVKTAEQIPRCARNDSVKWWAEQ